MCLTFGINPPTDPKNMVCKPQDNQKNINPLSDFIQSEENSSKKQENYLLQSKKENSKVQNFVYDKNDNPMLSFPDVNASSSTNITNKKNKDGLKIEIIDTNGFGDPAAKGVNDLKIKVNGKLTISKDSILNMINTATGQVLSESWTGDAKLGKASFYKDDKNYYIPIKSPLDDFGLNVRTEGNKIVIRTENTQASSLVDVLDKVKNKVEKSGLPFKVVKHDIEINGNPNFDERIELIPEFKGTSISKSINISNSNINEKNTKVNFDNDGNLSIELNNVEMQGKETISGKEKSHGDEDHASITIGSEIKINPHKANHTMGDIEVNIVDGDASFSLDKNESDFNLNELNLGRQFSDTKIKVENIHGKVIMKSDKNIPTTYAEMYKDMNPKSVDFEAKMKKLNGKTSTTIVQGLGGDVSLDLKGTGRDVKIKGELDINVKNEKTVFDNKSKKDITETKADLNLKNSTIETSFSYKDGTTEGNKTILDINAGIDEKGNITFNPKIIKTDANIDNTYNKVSSGTLELITGSDGAFKKLKEKAEKATESISIESFLLSGKPAEELSEILARKASQGIKVKLIIDSSFGDKKDTKGTDISKANETEFNGGIMIVHKAKNDLINKYNNDSSLTPEKKKKLIDNIEKNLDWRVLENGMLRIDHRKIWIIDGKEAISGGGVNLTQSAIVGSKKSNGSLNPPKHDSMYEIHGPVVRQLQEGFIGFWNKNSETPLPETESKKLLKNEKLLEGDMLNHKKGNKDLSISKTQVLYTDEKQKQIYQKMIEQIKKAEHTINLEHAYIDHPELVKNLEDAVTRGVTLNILLPEESDEQDFIKYNNYSAIETLKNKASQQGSKGKVNAYFYKNDVAFNHSKLMTFDGKSAIVGSANTTSRSLDNPIHYNKEMALFIEDDNFVKNVDKDLFEKDIKDSSIDLQKLINWTDYIIKNHDKIDRYKNIDGAS